MCGCSEIDGSNAVRVIDYSDYQVMVASVGFPEPTIGTNSRNTNHTEQKLFLFGDTLGVAAGTADGRSGCVTLPKSGIPVKMCWQITGDLIPPKVDVTVELSFSVGSVVYYQIKYRIQCDSIYKPSECSFDVINEKTGIDGTKGCSKSCLKKCAPQCIYCGSDWWCWAACTASCVAKCC